MDRVEYGIKLEQMTKLKEKGDYEAAAKVADDLDWRKVKKWSDMALAEEVYEKAGRPSDARNICVYAYNRNLGGKRLVYKLAELSILINDLDEADDLYREFVETAPNDMERYVLLYKLNCARGTAVDRLIEILEEYKKNELDEQYEYELATLYLKAGRMDDCIRECDDLILWFNEGEYVEKALRLKSQHAELTPAQAAKLRTIEDYRAKAKTYESVVPKTNTIAATAEDATEEIKVVEKDYSIYDTQNIQAALAESMAGILAEMGATDNQAAPTPAAPKLSDTQIFTAVTSTADESEVPVTRVSSEDTNEEEVDEPTKEIRVNKYHWKRYKSTIEEEPVQAAPALEHELSVQEEAVQPTVEPVEENAVSEAFEESERVQEDIIEGQLDIMGWLMNMNSEEPENDNSASEEPEAETAVTDEEVPENTVVTESVVEEEAVTEETEAVSEENVEEEAVVEAPEENVEEEAVAEVPEENAEEEAVEATEEVVEEEATENVVVEETVTEETEVAAEASEEVAEPEEAPVVIENTVEEEAVFEEMPADSTEAEEPVEAESISEETDVQEETTTEPVTEPSQETPAESHNPLQDTTDIVVSEITRQLMAEVTADMEEQSDSPTHIAIEEYADEEEELDTLTDEEKKYLGKYLFITGLEANAAQIIHSKKKEIPDGTSSFGNIAIMGKAKTDKTGFAINLFKALHIGEDLSQHKIAKTNATNINRNGIISAGDKVKGSTLIIENAGILTKAAIAELEEFMAQDTNGMLVILTGENFAINRIFSENPKFSAMFDYTIEIRHYSVNEMVALAKEYARIKGYAISDKALLKLYLIIGEIENSASGTEMEQVKTIVDDAIAHCRKKAKNPFGKNKTLIPLKDKDFQN